MESETVCVTDKGKEKRTVYVLTAVHNRYKITDKFVSQLKQQTHPYIKLVMVDDGSADGTAEMVRSVFPDAVIIRGDGGLWWGGALHQEYLWVKKHLIGHPNDILLISNDDVVYERDYIERGISRLEGVGRGMVLGNGISLHTGCVLDTAIRMNYGKKWDQSPFEHAEDGVGNCSSTRSLFLRVDTMLEIGGFHPILLPHYGSDYEWTMRAAKKGYPIYSFPDLSYRFDETHTGVNDYETLTIRSFFSKKSVMNPFYRFIMIVMTTPPRFILSELYKQVRRYACKADIWVNLIHKKRGKDETRL